MLDDTLVVWGGEFGRTVYCQGRLTADDYGRDHHPRCFTMWLAGGGIKPGIIYGETDDYCYNIVRDRVHVHDLHATILALPGHRPHQADVQVPGPQLPPDRRARGGRRQDSGVRARSTPRVEHRHAPIFAIAYLQTDPLHAQCLVSPLLSKI